MRLAGARATTASVTTRRRSASTEDPATPLLFLDVDDGLGAGEIVITPLQKGELDRQRVGFRGLWSTFGGRQRIERAGALCRRQSHRLEEQRPSRRRIAPIPPVSAARSISVRMRNLFWTVKVRRRGRSDNSGDAEAGAATTVGLRPSFEAAPASASICVWSMGMSEAILPRPQGLNSRGVNVSLSLARRAPCASADRGTDDMDRLADRWLPNPRIFYLWPSVRFPVKRPKAGAVCRKFHTCGSVRQALSEGRPYRDASFKDNS